LSAPPRHIDAPCWFGLRTSNVPDLPRPSCLEVPAGSELSRSIGLLRLEQFFQPFVDCPSDDRPEQRDGVNVLGAALWLNLGPLFVHFLLAGEQLGAGI